MMVVCCFAAVQSIGQGSTCFQVAQGQVSNPQIIGPASTWSGNPSYLCGLTATALIAANGGNSVVTSKNFYVEGEFVVNAPIQFVNCNLLFNSQGTLNLDPGQTLVLDGCNLRAACDTMWVGIKAFQNSSSVTVTN